ncbi:MAG: NnrS family protein [Gammaproteobacteria bacterium]
MKLTLFGLGFRPFFLFGSAYAAISIFVWVQIYSGQFSQSQSFLSPVIWHAHEMIFGYAMAVIAGFLLTAAQNWTGIKTLHGFALGLLLACWLVARILSFSDLFIWQASFDILFLIGLAIALFIPIFKSKNWVNLGMLAKVILMLASHVVFYLGVSGHIEDGERMGLYSGLYLIIGLMLTVARRVIPFFIERGVGYPVTLKNRIWIDRLSLILFLFFWMAEISMPDGNLVTVLAGILFLLHSFRLYGWHTKGIWNHPLLWSLYVAYGFLILGFLLKTFAGISELSPSLAVHTFTYGGIGFMTLAMMSRVTLGHTGRSLHDHTTGLFWMFLIIFSGAIIRVILPIIDETNYSLWINWSQLHWLIAFGIFLFIYATKLIMPRVDGKPG